MTDYPDFSANNYQIISELGRNNIGGRVTYLAEQTTTKEQVVIKQFQFAKMGATWAEYDAYEQEIEMLRHLDHPGIPKYLDSFQTADGFCMVQEYINAQSLAVSRSWSPKEIKKVAVAILRILVYLQSLKPSVIHRDLKPENILADEHLNIYLVDFGFARLGGGEIAASSVVKGTMGFMPPEQLFNRQLTNASDLYGLGATLICLLTGIKSGNLGNLIDENYQIKFQHLVPPLKRGLISWLEKISQPNPKERYANAREALKVLNSLDVDRLPKVRISKNKLEFVAKEFGEKVTEAITISNPIPETVLSGRWEVAPHKSDPPHTPYDHAWIEFDSYQFEGNNVECKIAVDSGKLLAGKSYQRELLLHSNSGEESLVIPVEVKTAVFEKPNVFSYLVTFILTAIFGFLWSFLYLVTHASLIPVCMGVCKNYLSEVSALVMSFILLAIISERILNASAEEKKIDIFFIFSLSVLWYWLIVMVSVYLDSAGPYSYSFLALKFFIWLFGLTMVFDLGLLIGINYKLKRVKNNSKMSSLWLGLIMCFIVADPALLLAELIWLPLVTIVIFGGALKLMVKCFSYCKSQKLLTKNALAFSGFSWSLVMAIFLQEKLFFNLDRAANHLNWSFGALVLMTLEFVVMAVIPILFFGLSLANGIVKYLRAIARYNREKPNLIKP
jgi:serine/threonine protein kinase